MLKPIPTPDPGNLAAAATEHANALAHTLRRVSRVFQVLHGCYGGLFLSKYSNGVVNADGEDEGMLSTQRVWAKGLSEFDDDTIRRALDRVKVMHPEFPPSLPQLEAICRACAPREACTDSHPDNGPRALPMSGKLRSEYAARARAVIAKHDALARQRRTGSPVLDHGLTGLKQAIARAVADAGGDEAAELRRLDHMLPTKTEMKHGGAAR